MSYDLQAFIGPSDHFLKLFTGCSGVEVIGLNQGFSLIPVSEELFEIIHEGKPVSEISDFGGEVGISKDIEEFGRLSSKEGMLAYVNISYNGGHGFQLAMAWKNESVLFDLTVDSRQAPPGPDGAVNRALSSMGVVVANAVDEFSELQLGSQRETDDWLE